jgi:hypothetical protein
MEHLQASTEAEKLNRLSKTIEEIAVAKEESKVAIARRLTASVAKAAKELDSCVEKVGLFFEDILGDELAGEKYSEQLTANGYPEPSEHPLGIPNTLTEEAYQKFEMASHSIITAKDSELRTQAMFLMSLCNSLIFERRMVEEQLLLTRDARRKAVLEIMKIRLMKDKALSGSMTNFRTQF